MSNKNENNFCIISFPGGLLKLDIMVHKANVLTYIWSFSENLENYGKLMVVDMSNKKENKFCIISCPGGLLKLDIMVHKAIVLTYIWSFSENLVNYRKMIL